MINQESKSTQSDYCVRVTANDGEMGEKYLRQFQDNENTIPTILTTSKKLSTGVDALNIRNIVLMRRVKSMIEFKQIIGRGTRLFDGKNYFTIIDFVDAYHHFSDLEWDGEPIVVECLVCDQEPCICESDPPVPCTKCNASPCVCEKKPPTPCEKCGGIPCVCIRKVKIKLADGKERQIESMTSTVYMLDGNPVSAEQFLKQMFDTLQLPSLFGSEVKLRQLWACPVTRRGLLKRIEEAGCSKSDLLDLQAMINAQDSDLFDVLQYISYANKPITRRKRAENAQKNIYHLYNEAQREFIEFVLQNYIKDGIDALDNNKLDTLITIKYKTITDAKNALGDLRKTKTVFLDFQQYLYKKAI